MSGIVRKVKALTAYAIKKRRRPAWSAAALQVAAYFGVVEEPVPLVPVPVGLELLLPVPLVLEPLLPVPLVPVPLFWVLPLVSFVRPEAGVRLRFGVLVDGFVDVGSPVGLVVVPDVVPFVPGLV